jgi:hypothetical protein
MELHSDCPSTLLNNSASALYRNPGLNPRAPQFQKLLAKPFLIVNQLFCCNENSALDVSLMDLMVLSLLLKNQTCAIKKLVFVDCEFSDHRPVNLALVQLCEALQVCKSICSLFIIGGNWSATNLQRFFEVVQIGNPRIRNFAIEKPQTANRFYDEIGKYGSRLLLDYFNYTIPGITSLSLHGCSLRDEQMNLVAKGLEVNTSIQFLCLSLNWITDRGFLTVFEAIKNSSNSGLECIDCSYNFIIFGNRVKQSVLKYRSRKNQHYLLEIVLCGNRIHSPLHPIEFTLSQRISPPLSIRYSEDEFSPKRKKNDELSMKKWRRTK